ncbi:MAG: hypothetical protein C5B48_10590 [Candidatus Rokuibacteriota bacterium]|nr:MAG: hypothetical protein C5B48_10590 [Candidatus Rokubacteria bacterium]
MPALARATPTWLSAINLSDPGQDGFDPQVAVDSSGDSLVVWNRSDGSKLRIQAQFRATDGTFGPIESISASNRDASQPQVAFDPSGNAVAVWTQSDGANQRIHAAFRPAGGSFGADQTISDAGQNASSPQIAFDGAGNAVAVWYRFDGANDRVQAAIRPASGSFGPAQTLSPPGFESFNPEVAGGPNVDANGVAIWTGSDGVHSRVQTARRRDVVGFPRPRGATPMRVSLVPAFNQCTSANRTHGAPLAFGSCAPPQQTSSVLTVGTPDANGSPANFTGFVLFNAVAGNSSTEANEADVKIQVAITDVRNRPSLTDYVGRVLMRADLQITDNSNSAETPEPGTVQTFKYSAPVDCVSTPSTSVGSSCNLTTTANTLVPGTVIESRRSIWQLGQVEVMDAGPNGTGYQNCPPTCGDGDEATFLREGIFAP